MKRPRKLTQTTTFPSHRPLLDRNAIFAASDGSAAVAVVRFCDGNISLLKYAPSVLGNPENNGRLRNLVQKATRKAQNSWRRK